MEKIIVFDEKFVAEFKAGWQWRLRCKHRESITEFDAGMWGSMIEFIQGRIGDSSITAVRDTRTPCRDAGCFSLFSYFVNIASGRL